MNKKLLSSLKALFLIYLCLAQIISSQAADETMPNQATSNNEATIREFVAAWSNLDADELAAYFTEDGVYFNIPTQAISGRDNVRNFISNFIQPWESTDWEILNIIAQGDIVMVERIDHTIAAGKNIDLPCFGIFEMQNGKIKEWRDYFNLATYTDALRASN